MDRHNLPAWTEQLTESQCKIIECLFAANGRVVELDRLINWLYGDDADGGPDNASATVRVMITQLRHRLPAGWQVQNQWGRGWRLVQEPQAARTTDISALKALIDKVETVIGGKRETLSLAAADLARTIGLTATAHELASLAQDMIALAEQQQEAGNG